MTAVEMTEAEIMKALYSMYCATAYKDTITMDKETAIGIYDLINRKNAENEDLQNQLSIFKKLLDKAETEIEKFADIGKMYSEIKAEAIKEFWEKVKEICTVPNDRWIPTNWVSAEIDQIAKEMGVEL